MHRECGNKAIPGVREERNVRVGRPERREY